MEPLKQAAPAGADAPSPAARSAQVAAVFDRVADVYDNVGVPWFTPIARELIRLAGPRPGERVLDAGCGRGAALLPAAEAVGDTGAVTGIDLSAGMIQACGDEVRRRGLGNVELRVMDASAPALPAAGFDLIVSSLVVFFLPDPLAALTAWRGLLAPGGRLAISTFGPRDPVWDAVDRTFRPYLPARMLDARTTGETGPFASDGGVEQLLTAAGLVRPRTTVTEVQVVLTGVGEWEAFSRSHGQRAMWDAVPPADQPAVRDLAAGCLEQARGADGLIRLGQRVRYTVAELP